MNFETLPDKASQDTYILFNIFSRLLIYITPLILLGLIALYCG